VQAYSCDDTACEEGYPVVNRTGSVEEARWLQATGFPTVAEYKLYKEGDVETLKSRAEKGDITAEALLGDYYLDQGDDVSATKHYLDASSGCSLYSYRGMSRLQMAGNNFNPVRAAMELRSAYLLGDTGVSDELGTLIQETSARDNIAQIDNWAALYVSRLLRDIPTCQPRFRPVPDGG